MDGQRFDTITRLVAADVSRRGVVRGAVAGLAGAVFGSTRAASGRAQGANLGCCRCTGAGSPPGCQSARDLGDCRQLCGRSTAAFDPIATCDETSNTCRAQVAAADDHGCCFCLKEPGRSRGCVNAKDVEECKIHCKKDPTDSDEPLPADADVDFNTNKICQPSEAGGKQYVCRTKAMSTAGASTYDPIAFVGNVALALPTFASTLLAFVFNPEQAFTDGDFYGADPPDGWQGVLRTVFYLPDPNGVSEQGIGQALYLKGHWFDSDANARTWYGAGKQLIEASGNGQYVDQTGEADFGIQRTAWGASFSPADNPEVTINRGIAWFRVGNVVLDATLDVYCAGATATGGDAASVLNAIVPSGGMTVGNVRLRPVHAALLTGDFGCDDGTEAILGLGPRLADNLRVAETERTVTRHLPVIPGTPVVQISLTQWGDQVIHEFGATAEERERREAFGFGAAGHLSGQYAGVDADGNPVAVFTNTWFVELFHDGQILLMDDLVEFVAASDQINGFERTEIPRLSLSGEGWAITANGFTIPREDGTKMGGVEVRLARDNVVATAAVVEATPLPPETTAQDVRDDFEQRVDDYPRGPAGPGPRDVLAAILVGVVSDAFGVEPRDLLEALDDDDVEEAFDLLNQVPPPDLSTEEAPKPVGFSIDEMVVMS